MPEQPDNQENAALPSTKKRKLHRYELVTAILGVVIGMIGIVGSTLSARLSQSTGPVARLSGPPNEIQPESIDGQLKEIGAKLNELDYRVTILSAPPEGSREALQIKELSANVAKLQESVSDMQKLIMDNPSKALAVPLMRKDLDGFKENSQAEAASIRKDLDRIYDLNKWLVGLMFTMALGILTLAISNFWKAKEKASEAAPK